MASRVKNAPVSPIPQSTPRGSAPTQNDHASIPESLQADPVADPDVSIIDP